MKADAIARRVGLLNRLRAPSKAKSIPGAEEERGESMPDSESRETAHASEQQHLAKLNYDGRHAISPKVTAPFK